jgi:hypothetical protein
LGAFQNSIFDINPLRHRHLRRYHKLVCPPPHTHFADPTQICESVNVNCMSPIVLIKKLGARTLGRVHRVERNGHFLGFFKIFFEKRFFGRRPVFTPSCHLSLSLSLSFLSPSPLCLSVYLSCIYLCHFVSFSVVMLLYGLTSTSPALSAASPVQPSMLPSHFRHDWSAKVCSS